MKRNPHMKRPASPTTIKPKTTVSNPFLYQPWNDAKEPSTKSASRINKKDRTNFSNILSPLHFKITQ